MKRKSGFGCLVRVLAVLLALLPSVSFAREESWCVPVMPEMYQPADITLLRGGELLICGTAPADEYSLGGTDGFVTCVSAEGEVLWNVRLGGSLADELTCAASLADGGCIVCGTTVSDDGHAVKNHGKTDCLLARLDAEGGIVWTRCIGGAEDDEVTSAVIDEEGMIYICGSTCSHNADFAQNFGQRDAFAACISPQTGRPEWTYSCGGAGNDMFTTIIPCYDGLLVLGNLSAEGMINAAYPAAVMLNLSGEEEWKSAIGSVGENTLDLYADINGGWMLAGTGVRSATMTNAHGRSDFCVAMLKSDGTMQWQKGFGGSGNERAFSVCHDARDGYLILGTTVSENGQVTHPHGGRDLWLIDISATGTLRWEMTLGGSGDTDPVGFLRLDSGELLVLGNTNSRDGDIGLHEAERTSFLMRLSENGNLLETGLLLEGKTNCTALSVRENGDKLYILALCEQGEEELPCLLCVER